MSLDPTKPIILAFVGMAGCGKDTVTNFMAKRYGTPVIHFGNIVYEEVHKRGLDIVTYERQVREHLRATEGLDVLAKRVAVRCHEFIKDGKSRIVLNGLYSWTEYKYMQKEFGDQFLCIALSMPRQLRYERLLNRHEAHRTYTLEQIKARDQAEIENSEKGGPIACADYTVANDSTPEKVFAEISDILHDLKF